jgi:hypothetical protein
MLRIIFIRNMDENNMIERYVENKKNELEIPSLTKLRESIFNLSMYLI